MRDLGSMKRKLRPKDGIGGGNRDICKVGGGS